MDPAILEQLSVLTEEEKTILGGSTAIDRALYMEGDRDVITGDKLLEAGKLITVRPHTRFIRFPKHTHDYVEMVYMASGSTQHTIGDTEITLREGELLILAQNAVQSIEPAGQSDVAVNFIVRPTFFSSVLPYLGEQDTPLRRFLIDCLTGKSETQYLLFRVSEVLPIQNLIENLLYTLLDPGRHRREIQTLTMALLFAQLMQHTDCMTVATGEQNAVVSVLRYIETNYRDGSLGKIADELHYELHFLSRLIKQRTGKTYTELLQEKRMLQAAWLLTNTARTVDEIALSVGYENISYFHRVFRQTFGVSPKNYRSCK
ncbi:MAG: helix-turn-helix domain-containing protein [Clostridia bacterium]|nr:helix-turn-helix domain-containing protein [Clostridia bacterium]